MSRTVYRPSQDLACAHGDDAQGPGGTGGRADGPVHGGAKWRGERLEEHTAAADKVRAMRGLNGTRGRGDVATGLIYIEPDRDDFITQMNVVDEPLATLPLSRTRPGKEALEEIMEGLR